MALAAGEYAAFLFWTCRIELIDPGGLGSVQLHVVYITRAYDRHALVKLNDS